MTTVARPRVPAAVRGRRISKADAFRHADRAERVFAAAFPGHAARAIAAGVTVHLWNQWSSFARCWRSVGLEIRRGEARAYVRVHDDGVAASVVRRKVLSLFEVQS